MRVESRAFSPPAFGGTKRLLPGRMQETSSSCKNLSESLEDTVELLCLASRSFVASDYRLCFESRRRRSIFEARAGQVAVASRACASLDPLLWANQHPTPHHILLGIAYDQEPTLERLDTAALISACTFGFLRKLSNARRVSRRRIGKRAASPPHLRLLTL